MRNCLTSRGLVEDNKFDWMTMKVAPPISPYSEHPFKARQVLGTSEELSIQDRTSPGLQGNVQYLREVEYLRDRQRSGQQSRSWSGESGLDSLSPVMEEYVPAKKEEEGKAGNEPEKNAKEISIVQEDKVNRNVLYSGTLPILLLFQLVLLDPDTSITQSFDTVKPADTPRDPESSESASVNCEQEESSSGSEPFPLNQLETNEETEKDAEEEENGERKLGPLNLALNANTCQCSCFPAFMGLFKK